MEEVTEIPKVPQRTAFDIQRQREAEDHWRNRKKERVLCNGCGFHPFKADAVEIRGEYLCKRCYLRLDPGPGVH